MEYISTKKAAVMFNVSQEELNYLCAKNKVSGARLFDNNWFIPSEKLNERIVAHNEIQPFVKWAGGKRQLIPEIEVRLPKGFGTKIVKYAEPFVGGGAVLLYILNNYNLKGIFVSDINSNLINSYIMIKEHVEQLICLLLNMQKEYLALENEQRKEYFYDKRKLYNEVKFTETNDLQRAALFIFLNKTCFNGLYRENSQGLFNVPIGAYKKPIICDAENLMLLAQKLQNVDIVCGDFQCSKEFIDENTFVYFDPPYRPLNKTANFTSYSKDDFTDENQEALAMYFKLLHKKNAKLLLSNSDPHNIDVNDNFFDELYSGFIIDRIEAKRMINSKGSARGNIKELLIYNYEV
jgi:DNA adenine methylase